MQRAKKEAYDTKIESCFYCYCLLLDLQQQVESARSSGVSNSIASFVTLSGDLKTL
jgi:hypothetical protein